MSHSPSSWGAGEDPLTVWAPWVRRAGPGVVPGRLSCVQVCLGWSEGPRHARQGRESPSALRRKGSSDVPRAPRELPVCR